MTQSGQGAKLQSVQVARGVAALLVALFHGQHVVQQALHQAVAPFNGFFEFGHAGVEFFFVLSGFIIFFVHRSDIGMPGQLPQYFWKRATRIYPLFLFVMMFVAAKALVRGEFHWAHFLKTVFLLPQPPYPMLIQSWTLVHEMLFYLLFGLAILNLKLARIGVALWLIVVAGIGWFHPAVGEGFAADFVMAIGSAHNLLFLLGIAVAWMSEELVLSSPRLLAALGALTFLAIGIGENLHLVEQAHASTILMFGAASAVMLLGLVRAEASGSLHVPAAFGQVMGNLSYPLYLIHGMVISVTASAFSAFNYSGPGWTLLLLAVLAASLASLLLNRFVEQPMAAFLHRFWTNRHGMVSSLPGARLPQ